MKKKVSRTVRRGREEYFWSLLRISLGLILLWAFFDKLFGLGFSTTADKSWIAGTSPTYGFLKIAAYGPLAPFFNSLAGNIFVDVLFMAGLLLIGLAMLLGIARMLAGYSGALMMLLMWLARLPPNQNPVFDDHIIYLLVFLAVATTKAGQWLSLNKWWSKTMLARKYICLR